MSITESQNCFERERYKVTFIIYLSFSIEKCTPPNGLATTLQGISSICILTRRTVEKAYFCKSGHNFHYLHISVQLEVSSLVTHREVISCQFWFGTIKSHLITSKPAFITKDSRTVDCRSSKIKVNITTEVYTFTFVGWLNFTTFLSETEKELC